MSANVAHGNPLLPQVLADYPGFDISTLNWPPDAVSWNEKDLDLFIGSGGFIKPKKKPKAAAKPVVEAPPAENTHSKSNGGYPLQVSSSPVKNDVSPSSVPPVEMKGSEETSSTCSTPDSCKSSSKDDPLQEEQEIVSSLDADLSVKRQPVEWLNTVVVPGVDGHTVVPITTHLEDLGPNGMHLTAMLNKFARCRSLLLNNPQSGLDLAAFMEKHNAGVLLREFACEVETPNSAYMMSPMSVLDVHTSVELPIRPFFPFRQRLFGKSQAGKDEMVAEARFGHLLLDIEKMAPLENASLYGQVAAEVRQMFALPPPNGDGIVPKFPTLYPKLGRSFRPSQRLQSEYTVSSSDCDMYRVIFHPRMCQICEAINFNVRADFCKMSPTAVYANLAKPVQVGDRLDVHLFVQDEVNRSRRVAVLYLFLMQSSGDQGNVTSSTDKRPSMTSSCVMTVMMIYGEPPGRLSSEEVEACGSPNFAKLCQVATGCKTNTSVTQGRRPSDIDFSLLL
eukprot:gnl/MRDRNA2_/MRDRNA2_112765_c0_seq1.p1 gnl/MRDRNA2_/MRDRNA2_112765_c0~~gnl/MRDRNA2_/MRDRNA2_112765_c0_seq1.p1  ORF type:complete len:506 (-),score=81.11 gnl/MRDRNA2_/MRDRNA2_112765_c0_seq1:209-1726(-)